LDREPGVDPVIEEARKAVLGWQRAGKPRLTKNDTALSSQVALYGDAVAKRLNTSPIRGVPLRQRNNGLGEDAVRARHEALAAQAGFKPTSVERLADAMSHALRRPELVPAAFPNEPDDGWRASTVPSFRPERDDGGVLIHGLDAIAEALGRDATGVLRSARKRTLPIAILGGEWVMLKSMIDGFATPAAKKRNKALAIKPTAVSRPPRPVAKPEVAVERGRLAEARRGIKAQRISDLTRGYAALISWTPAPGALHPPRAEVDPDCKRDRWGGEGGGACGFAAEWLRRHNHRQTD